MNRNICTRWRALLALTGLLVAPLGAVTLNDVPRVSAALQKTAQAQALATKGHGVSYFTQPEILVLGVNAGVAWDAPGKSYDEIKGILSAGDDRLLDIGIGLQFSLMAGLNLGYFKSLPQLGVFDPKRLTIYASFGAFDFARTLAVKDFTAQSKMFGGHLQYKLFGVRPLGANLLQWGGVDLMTGIETAANTFTQPSTSSELKATSFSVPVEASSSVRFLYALSLFGGLGLDFNSSQAKFTTKIPLGLPANLSSFGNFLPTIERSDSGRGTEFRLFAGAAVNLIPLKQTNVLSVFAQINYALSGVAGGFVGVRAGW